MGATLPGLFDSSVRRDGGRPFVTFYDDVSGERIELSHATTANWVAKTANLLVDEIDLEPGETVRVALPPHWLGIVWSLAAWSCGAAVSSAESAGGDVAVVGPDTLDVRGGRATLASALLPLGGRFRETLPDGVVDYGAEVYNHGDHFVAVDPPGPDSAAYEGRTHAELIATAEPITGRVLSTTCDPLLLARLITGGGSLVLCRNLDPAKLERRVADEKADTVLEAS